TSSSTPTARRRWRASPIFRSTARAKSPLELRVRAPNFPRGRSSVMSSAMEQAKPNETATLPVSVRLSPELDQQLAYVAKALHRSKSWVIEQAIKDFVAVPAWHLAAIDEGIPAAGAEQVVPHDDVAAWVRSWGKPDELSIPGCK